jgi:hypothetical protein
MDVLGAATYLWPVLGESFDIVFAPISAIVYYFVFGGKKAIIGASINFIEELLPFTDIIPTFTISWFLVKENNKP